MAAIFVRFFVNNEHVKKTIIRRKWQRCASAGGFVQTFLSVNLFLLQLLNALMEKRDCT